MNPAFPTFEIGQRVTMTPLALEKRLDSDNHKREATVKAVVLWRGETHLQVRRDGISKDVWYESKFWQ